MEGLNLPREPYQRLVSELEKTENGDKTILDTYTDALYEYVESLNLPREPYQRLVSELEKVKEIAKGYALYNQPHTAMMKLITEPLFSSTLHSNSV